MNKIKRIYIEDKDKPIIDVSRSGIRKELNDAEVKEEIQKLKKPNLDKKLITFLFMGTIFFIGILMGVIICG